MSNKGNLVLINRKSKKRIWQSGIENVSKINNQWKPIQNVESKYKKNTMITGEYINANETIPSINGKSIVKLTTDGTLIIYKADSKCSSKPEIGNQTGNAVHMLDKTNYNIHVNRHNTSSVIDGGTYFNITAGECLNMCSLRDDCKVAEYEQYSEAPVSKCSLKSAITKNVMPSQGPINPRLLGIRNSRGIVRGNLRDRMRSFRGNLRERIRARIRARRGYEGFEGFRRGGNIRERAQARGINRGNIRERAQARGINRGNIRERARARGINRDSIRERAEARGINRDDIRERAEARGINRDDIRERAEARGFRRDEEYDEDYQDEDIDDEDIYDEDIDDEDIDDEDIDDEDIDDEDIDDEDIDDEDIDDEDYEENVSGTFESFVNNIEGFFRRRRGRRRMSNFQRNMARQRQRIARARARAMARNSGNRFRRRFRRSQLPRRRRVIPPPPPPPPPFPEVKDDEPVMNMNDLMSDGKKSLGSKLTTVYEKRDKSYLDNRKHLGKYGYVDLENKLYKYDDSMIKYTDDYDFIRNSTTEGTTILEGTGSSLEGSRKCSEYESCGGYIYDRVNRKYTLKDKSMYPFGRKQYHETNGIFVRKTQLDANKTCPKEIRNISGNIWEKTLPVEGTIMNADELCGIYKLIEKDYENVNYLEKKYVI